MDMAFYVVEQLFGKDVADETAHYIEYRRLSKTTRFRGASLGRRARAGAPAGAPSR